MRKHFTQMTTEETKFLAARVQATKTWGFTNHARVRMTERHASGFDVLKAIAQFDVIEANFDRGSKVLVRGKGQVDGKQVCAVLAPEDHRVVTVYFNRANDKHSTINMNAYEASVDVLREYWKH